MAAKIEACIGLLGLTALGVTAIVTKTDSGLLQLIVGGIVGISGAVVGFTFRNNAT